MVSAACASRTAPPVAAPAAPPVAAAPAAATPAKVALPDSVVWFRTSVEYRATALQAYRLASLMLDRALADRTWTAALEQAGEFASKPPAVILDVDETVLDNSESEERNVREGAAYNEARWAEWCNERKATPIPGALEFTRAAAAKGVAVFYVTNRDRALEQATRDNLGEVRVSARPGPRHGAHARRAARMDVLREVVAAEPGGAGLPHPAARRRRFRRFRGGRARHAGGPRALDDAHAAMWGVKWIALPNPLYGSWKTAAGQ